MENKLLEFYDKAIEICANNASLNEITRLAYEMFSLPIIVVDVAYHMLAYANNGAFIDPAWQVIVEKGAPQDDTILRDYIEDGYLDHIAACKKAVVIDWGICKEYPQTSGPIYINQKLEGFVSVLYLDKEKEELSLQLNGILCQIFAILFRTYPYLLKESKNPLKEILAQKIFDTAHFPQAPHLEDYQPYVDVIPNYQIVLLKLRENRKGVLSHVRKQLSYDYPYMLYRENENSVQLFLHHIDSYAFYIDMEKLLTTYHVYAGLSRQFNDLTKREQYLLEAQEALNIGLMFNPEKVLHFYDDYYSEYFIKYALETMDQNMLIIPEVQKLINYDNTHHSDFHTTLYHYVYERNDINRCAKQMHIHRNTLIYRLQKIKDIMGMDIDDAENAWRIQVSLEIVKLSSGTIIKN